MVGEIDKRARGLLANTLFDEARDTTRKVLEDLQNFADENLDVVLFSGEGDSLHQIFDCIMQGPYAKVDFWTRGAEGQLSVPSWARDANGAGLSREMDLPCHEAKLKGDYAPPFTCGGDTRRSIIKTFVREYINNGGGENGNTLTEKLIRQQIQRLIQAWGDTSKYPCNCGNGTHALDCCFTYPRGSNGTLGPGDCLEQDSDENADTACVNNFLPQSLNVSFDEISGDSVIREIVEQIPAFLNQTFTDKEAAAFTLHNSAEEVRSWDWVETGYAHIAAAEGIYASYEPIVNYSAGEAGFPFKYGRSLWYMCTGLVSQVRKSAPPHMHNLL